MKKEISIKPCGCYFAGVSIENLAIVEAPLQSFVRITHDCPPFPGLGEETCPPCLKERVDSRLEGTTRPNPLWPWRRALRGVCPQGTVWKGWCPAQGTGRKCPRWAGWEGVGAEEEALLRHPRSLGRDGSFMLHMPAGTGCMEANRQRACALAELGISCPGGLQTVSSQL